MWPTIEGKGYKLAKTSDKCVRKDLHLLRVEQFVLTAVCIESVLRMHEDCRSRTGGVPAIEDQFRLILINKLDKKQFENRVETQTPDKTYLTRNRYKNSLKLNSKGIQTKIVIKT